MSTNPCCLQEHLIQSFGYSCETHDVTTEDGYIIRVHRIPRGRKRRSLEVRTPVIIIHGFLSVSDVWLFRGPKRDLRKYRNLLQTHFSLMNHIFSVYISRRQLRRVDFQFKRELLLQETQDSGCQQGSEILEFHDARDGLLRRSGGNWLHFKRYEDAASVRDWTFHRGHDWFNHVRAQTWIQRQNKTLHESSACHLQHQRFDSTPEIYALHISPDFGIYT